MDLLPYHLHIFDLDDTLINTKSAYRFAQESAIRNHYPSIPPGTLNTTFPSLHLLCREFGSGNVQDYLTAFIDGFPDTFHKNDSTIETLLQDYHKVFANSLQCFENAIEYLSALREAGKALVLVTNGKTDSQIKKLQLTSLSDFFPKQNSYISADYKSNQKKPSSYMIDKACLEHQTAPSSAIYYGNTVSDMIAGNLAGVSCVHVAVSTPLPENSTDIAKPLWILKDWKTALEAL